MATCALGAVASLLAPAEDCGVCAWVDGDTVLCEPHVASTDAALAEASKTLSSRRATAEEQLAALSRLMQAAADHANAPSRAVASLLVKTLEHDELAVRVAAIRALKGQHPEVAAQGFIEAGEAFVEMREEFLAGLGKPMKAMKSLQKADSKKATLKALEDIQGELADQISELEVLALYEDAWREAVLAGLFDAAPSKARDEMLADLVDVLGYTDAEAIVEALMAEPSRTSLAAAVRPFEFRGKQLDDELDELDDIRKQKPAKAGDPWKKRKAEWKQKELDRIAAEAAAYEARLEPKLAHLERVKQRLAELAREAGLPDVPEDVTAYRLWSSWARRAGATLP